jgi:MFS family permease
VSVVLLMALLRQRDGSGAAEGKGVGSSDLSRAVGGVPLVLASLVLMGIGGLVGSAINLLVPLQLSNDGLSTALIGGVFAISAVAFIVTSAAVTRFYKRAVDARLGALAIALTAMLLTLPLLSGSRVAMVTLLLARAPLGGLTVTITFPLAVMGASQSGISTGAVLATLNLVWAASVCVGPLVAGSIAQSFGNWAAYLVLIVACALATWPLGSVGIRMKGIVAR